MSMVCRLLCFGTCIYLSLNLYHSVMSIIVQWMCIYLKLKFVPFCKEHFVSTCTHVVTSDLIVPKLRQLITCTNSCVCLLYPSLPPLFCALLPSLSPLPFPHLLLLPLPSLSFSSPLLSSPFPRVWLCTF